MQQMNLFEATYEKPSFPSHVKLIELFAGIGAQFKSLKALGVDVESHRTCEWSWQSIIAYNAIHHNGEIADTSHMTYQDVLGFIEGVSHDYNKPMTRKNLERRGEEWCRKVAGAMITNHNLCPDVSKLHGKDLDIRDKDENLFIITYSFPCQDLSNAGRQKGYDKGTGTRSGLLWEVERILLELKETNSLPQVLLMENVPAVCNQSNLKPWNQWLEALQRMGYTNYFQILNSKDFQIPQNRERCFMISLLGEHSFSFPFKMPQTHNLESFIVKTGVGGWYYLPDSVVANFVQKDDGDP